MDAISAALIAKALDGLNQRYQFTAQNIANANTPDYAPVHVAFEDRLREAAAHGVDAIRSVEPQIITDASAPGQPVRLDLELAAASQTAMRYRALLTVLGQQLALNRAVIAAGR